MSMNFVIQERRKELGLTQEQVAEYLNVSVPAVCKWEKGVTSPDISLLPSLARLLQTDLNTLFCFKEDLSIQEISNFCKEIAEIVQEKGISQGFEAAKSKIHTYPYNETLLHCLTLQLDGLLLTSGLSEMRPFYNTITGWYQKLMESDDSSIRNSASYMMAGRLIRSGEYDKAQQVLDTMPSKDDFLSTLADNEQRWNQGLQRVLSTDSPYMKENAYRNIAVKAMMTLNSNWRTPAGDIFHGCSFPSYTGFIGGCWS